MPLTYIIEVKIFDVLGFDFMVTFPSSWGNKYILIVNDYVSKKVETVTNRTNDIGWWFVRSNILFSAVLKSPSFSLVIIKFILLRKSSRLYPKGMRYITSIRAWLPPANEWSSRNIQSKNQECF